MTAYTICLIGNSHLAALAQAWRKDRQGARSEVSLVYFGMRGGSDWELALQDGALSPTDDEGRASFQRSSRGRSAIAVNEYDAFVIYGLGLQVSKLMPLFLEHGILEDQIWGPISQLISRDSLAAAVRAGLTVCTGLKVLEQIRSISQVPALVCPMPFRSEAAFSRIVSRPAPAVVPAGVSRTRGARISGGGDGPLRRTRR